MNLQQIPGYKEAVDAEQLARSSVLLGVGAHICSVDVRPFAVQDLIHLQAIKSPFVSGGFISRMDCLRFLVMQAKNYKRPGAGWIERFLLKRRNRATMRAVRNVATSELIKGINAFIDDAFLDAPASANGSAVSSAPIASSGAVMVDAIASEYSWPISEILSLEVALVFQLFRLRHVASGGNRAALINRKSSKVVGDYLRELNTKMGVAQ